VATTAAIAGFQQARGLPSTGDCDAATWSALVESSWSLGARLLYLTSPHLRGDDVEQLQIRLARLGFHCGKADGIFGPRTAGGVTDFQQNMGLTVDGICGDPAWSWFEKRKMPTRVGRGGLPSPPVRAGSGLPATSCARCAPSI
jgi:peptidoglycan hydrolase-like protein with peptidoglycan-binding domain